MVMLNSHIHQRGIGLISSVRPSSQLCPVVSTCPLSSTAVATLTFECAHSNSPQPKMPSRVKTEKNIFQKPLVKTAMMLLRHGCIHILVLFRDGQIRRFGESLLATAAIGPPYDAEKGDEAHYGDHRARIGKLKFDIHDGYLALINVPIPCR